MGDRIQIRKPVHLALILIGALAGTGHFGRSTAQAASLNQWTNIISTDGQFEFVDSNPATFPRRFYRVARAP